jgi:hypothetical protein
MDSLTAFRITVVLESIPDPKGLGGRYTFPVQLGHDPIRTLFGHPDDCVRSEGELTVKQTTDTLQIVFTPWSRDCGLVAQGTVAGSVFVGRWHEPRFTGTGASGPIRMQRINARRR